MNAVLDAPRATKVCTRCGEEKPFDEFYKNKHTKSGRNSACKTCIIMLARAWQVSNPDVYRASKRKWEAKNRVRGLIRSARARAKKREIAFDLYEHTDDIIARVDAGFCEVSGLPFSSGTGGNMAPSIDRIEPAKGYTYDNIRIVCWAVNAGCNAWGLDEAKRIWKAVIERQQ